MPFADPSIILYSGRFRNNFSPDVLLTQVAAEQANGFVFDDSLLADLAASLRKRGFSDLAAAAQASGIRPKSGPCSVPLPIE